MLSRVLLHMIPAAGGVDLATDAAAGPYLFQWRVFRSFKVVHHPSIFRVCNLRDTEFRAARLGGCDPAGVVNLATAGGVERGPVENHGRARRFHYRAHLGVKVVQKRIVIVEAFGHTGSSTWFQHKESEADHQLRPCRPIIGNRVSSEGRWYLNRLRVDS